MKKLLIYSALAFALVLPTGAQNSPQDIAAPQTSPGVSGANQEVRQKILDEIKAGRDTLKSNIKDMKHEFKTNVQERRTELKDLIQNKREALKEQLQKVKDERKKAAVERIDIRLDELNERMTNHFSSLLDKLEDVLTRVSSRADKAEEKGLSVSSVRTAVTEALSAIEAARTAVTDQTGKTYTIVVSSEDNLRVDVGKARQALHGDLAKVRETIRTAHEAVKSAAVLLAQIHRIDEAESLSTDDGQNNSNQ